MSIFPERWMGRTIPTHNIPEHYIKDGKKYNTRTNEEVPKKKKRKLLKIYKEEKEL